MTAISITEQTIDDVVNAVKAVKQNDNTHAITMTIFEYICGKVGKNGMRFLIDENKHIKVWFNENENHDVVKDAQGRVIGGVFKGTDFNAGDLYNISDYLFCEFVDCESIITTYDIPKTMWLLLNNRNPKYHYADCDKEESDSEGDEEDSDEECDDEEDSDKDECDSEDDEESDRDDDEESDSDRDDEEESDEEECDDEECEICRRIGFPVCLTSKNINIPLFLRDSGKEMLAKFGIH